MNISQAARESGLSPKTIRYDEHIGLVAECSGDEGPECAILDELGAETSRLESHG